MIDLLNSGMFKDLTIVVEGKKILLHKVVVAARSEYFDTILKSNFKEKNESTIEIKECTFAIFKKLCEHIYSDKVKIEYDTIYSIMEMADRFGVTHLKERLQSAIMEYITADNAAKIYKFSSRYNYDRLRNISTSYINDHYTQIVHTEEFAELDKDDILRIIRLHIE